MADYHLPTGYNRINTQLEQKRSNYLYAFPPYLDCLDFFRLLSMESPGTDFQWLKSLQSKEGILLDLHHLPEEVRRLRHLYFENRNQIRLQNNHAIHLGFPVISWSDDQDRFSAPCFLLPLQLEPSVDSLDKWIIRCPSPSMLFNPFLLEKFRDAEVLHERPENILSGTIEQQVRQLCELFELDWPQEMQWSKFPSIKELEAGTSEFALHKTAILGIFPSPERLLSVIKPEKKEEFLDQARWKHHFAHLPLDPSQSSAIQNVYFRHSSVVTGDAGSGKKHLLHYLLVNALSNGKKILVVSGRFSAIRELQLTLDQLRLTKLGHWLRGGFSGIETLLGLLRAEYQKERVPLRFDKEGFNQLLDALQQQKEKVDAAYRSVRRSVFGPFDWPQSVGLFLKSNAKAGKELLGTQLKTFSFSFEPEEYAQMAEAINRAQPLYQALGTMRHPLRSLKQEIFLTLDKEEAHQLIQQKLEGFLRSFSHLQQQYISLINTYSDKLHNYFEGYYFDLMQRIQHIESVIKNKRATYGDDFSRAATASLRVGSVFNARSKKILEDRRHLLELGSGLIEQLKNIPNFDFSNQPDKFSSVPDLENFLEHLKQAINNWKEEIEVLVSQDVLRLNSKNVHPELNMEDSVLRMEEQLENDLHQLNESDLFQQAIQHKMLTIVKKQQLIESVLELLETTSINLRDFTPFYDWQAFWLRQNKVEKELISAIIRVKPESWVTAFESWYLHQLLLKKQLASLPQKEVLPAGYVERVQQLQQLLPAQIRFDWDQRVTEALKKIRRSDRKLQQILQGQEGNEQDLFQQLFSESLGFLTEFIPAIFCDPVTAFRTFKAQPHPIFDVVAFESAQYIDEDLGQHLRDLGKQVVFIGDNRFILDDGKDDLLEAVNSEELPTSKLQYFHRYYPANLWQISEGNNITEDAIGNYNVLIEPHEFYYDEDSCTNQGEAERILYLLNTIEKTPQRTYPSVAIVAMTTQQRNLIASYLLSIKNERNTEQSDFIRQLERNGLIVMDINELEGNHFDVVILSVTYGLRPQDELLSRQIRQLNTPAGIRQINELMSTATNGLQIVHSLPREHIQKWSTEVEKDGFFLLANYLTLVESLQNADPEQQQRVIQHMQEWKKRKEPPALNTPIYDEIARYLQPFLGKERIISNFTKAQIRLPLVIKSHRSPEHYYAIIPDGYLAETAFSNIHWEFERRNWLIQHQITPIPVWTVRWWKEPELEARKLASIIFKKDEQES